MKTIDELNKTTVKELIKYCKDNGIPNYSNKKKSSLIDYLIVNKKDNNVILKSIFDIKKYISNQ